MDLGQYIVVVIVGICLMLGYIIKHSLDFIPNKYIPLIMAVIGTFLNIWLNQWSITPEILLSGIASGLASTGTFELVRNIATGNLTKVSSDQDEEKKN